MSTLPADGGEILLTRKLYASGRSGVSLNGRPITLGMLKSASEHLVDVHGQHDHQYLLKPANQLDVLDGYAGTIALREQYRQRVRAAYRRPAEARRAGAGGVFSKQQQLELYQFQADEIECPPSWTARSTSNSKQDRRSCKTSRSTLRKKDASAVHASLYEIDGSVLERLKMMVGVLSELAGLDVGLQPIAGACRDADDCDGRSRVRSVSIPRQATIWTRASWRR